MDALFRDRLEAGERLAAQLEQYRGSESIALGMARGGVVVGYPVARHVRVPLGALVVRKLGAPQNPELAIGAVSASGSPWLDTHLITLTGASDEYVQSEIERQVEEARRRQREYGIGRTLESVRGTTAIVVDDGIATGASALVAIQSARDLGAAHVVLAAPVASPQAARTLAPSVDDLVVLARPDPFRAVGLYYDQFDQVSDEEVIDYLQRAVHEVGR